MKQKMSSFNKIHKSDKLLIRFLVRLIGKDPDAGKDYFSSHLIRLASQVDTSGIQTFKGRRSWASVRLTGNHGILMEKMIFH